MTTAVGTRTETKPETKPMSDEALILVETDGPVGIIRINRPKVLNALNPELMGMLAEQLEAFDRDDAIYVVLLAGNERAFAAEGVVVHRGLDLEDLDPGFFDDLAHAPVGRMELGVVAVHERR